MAKQRVKWKHVVAYLEPLGYEFLPQGGDVVIVPPRNDPTARRSRAPVRIGHKFCRPNAELLDVHLSKLKRAFGVTYDEIMRK